MDTPEIRVALEHARRVRPPSGALERNWRSIQARAQTTQAPKAGPSPRVVAAGVGALMVAAAMLGLFAGLPRQRSQQQDALTAPNSALDAMPARAPRSTSVRTPDGAPKSAPIIEAAPRPASPVKRPATVTPAVSPFQEELALVRSMEAALAQGQPSRALELAGSHPRRFPEGRFVQERWLLEVRALCDMQRPEEAELRAEALVRANPTSRAAQVLARSPCARLPK